MSEKLPYKKDERLYALWKLLNSERLLGRDKARFEDLAAPEKGVRFMTMMLCQELYQKGLELDGLEFHTELFKKYNLENYKAVLDFIKEKPEIGVSKSFKKILDGKFSLQDIENACMLPKFELVEWFEFDAKLPRKTFDSLSKSLDVYLDAFISGDLAIENVNYLRFEEQKKNFLRELSGFYLSKFGKTFIYKTHIPIPFLGIDESDEEKLFIHTLIAMEKLAYFSIEAIWVYDWDLAPEEQKENYKVRMTISPKLLEEARQVTGIYSESKSKSEKSSPIPIFDENRSILRFRDKDIEISKSKNKNPHYLLKTLFKDKNKTWAFDEIAEDWGEEFIKTKWKRYWYAAYVVNGKIAKKTSVDDFLIATNKEILINKKYL